MTYSNAIRPVVLLQITDIHLHAAADVRMRGVPTYETFLAVLDQVQSDTRWPPDAIVVTGDIVQDESRAGYKHFREALKPLGLPIFCLPGNHDNLQLMVEMLADAPFQICGETTITNWMLVFLNTLTGCEAGGRLGKEELIGLSNTLAEHPDKHMLICMHHQPLPMGSIWLDKIGLIDAKEFLACIEQYENVRGVLWGHVHQVSDRTRDGIRFLSAPSTCVQFLPGSDSFALGTQPPGSRWLILETEGIISTEIDWLTEDKAT